MTATKHERILETLEKRIGSKFTALAREAATLCDREGINNKDALPIVSGLLGGEFGRIYMHRAVHTLRQSKVVQEK